MRVLVLDDQKEQLQFLSRILGESNIHTVLCTNVEDAWYSLHSQDFALLVVDCKLDNTINAGHTDQSGIDFVQRVRSEAAPDKRYLPIFAITSSRNSNLKIRSWKMGVDQFFLKPICKEELVICIKNSIARYYGHGYSQIECGDMCFDDVAGRFSVRDIDIKLSPKEFACVRCLMLRYNQTVSKSVILRAIYADKINDFDRGEDNKKMVDVLICKIRGKINEQLNLPDNMIDSYIVTVWGFGYKIVSPQKNISVVHRKATSDTNNINNVKDEDNVTQYVDEESVNSDMFTIRS